jgi:hypothetical protein
VVQVGGYVLREGAIKSLRLELDEAAVSIHSIAEKEGVLGNCQEMETSEAQVLRP